MGDNANEENTPPMCILLPMCVESEFDVFFNILRNVASHSKMDGHFLDHALKSGMTGETIKIEQDDMVVDWKYLQTKPKQILQSKLLGFWANQNAPSLGKKIFKPSWKPPQRKRVEVTGGKFMTPDEIDVIISGKIKLRVYEVRVSHGTLVKLKHFVMMPADVDLYNGEQISPKIRSYDIKPECVKRCYDALKFGKCDDSFNGNVGQQMKVRALAPSTSSSTSCRRKFDDTPALLTPSITFSRQKLDAQSENSVQSAKRARVDLNTSETLSESGCGTFRTVLIETQTHTGNSNQWLDPNVVGHDNERRETLNLMTIIRQNEEIIREMKLTAVEDRKEIENLKKEKASLKAQVETNTDVISALTKGVEANFKLYLKYEADLAASVGSIAEYVYKIGTLESDVRLTKDKSLELERHNQNLNDRLVDAENVEVEMTDRNKKLEEELSVLKDYAATKEKQLEEAVQIERMKTDDNAKLEERLKCLNSHVATMLPELQQQIAILEGNGSEMAEKNKKLEEELSVLKDYAATTEKQLEEAVQIERMKTDDNAKLEERLKCLNSHVATMLPELQQQIVILEGNGSEMAEKNKKLEEELSVLKDYAATTEKQLEEAVQIERMKTDDNAKLEERLKCLNSHVATMLPELQQQIAILEGNGSEMAEKNKKLEEELSVLKDYAATKEKQLEEAVQIERMKTDDNAKLEERLKCLNSHVATMLPELQQQIAVLEGNGSEMAEKNKKLEDELSVLKDYAATKEKQLEEAVQIERMKTDDNAKLEERLKCLNSHVATMLPELQQQIAILEGNGSEMAEKNKKLEDELSVLKDYAATKEKQLEEAVQIERMKADDNAKLEERLKCLNSHIATMLPELQQQIAILERNGSEMSEKNKKLEEELSVWKNGKLKEDVEEGTCEETQFTGLSLPEAYGSNDCTQKSGKAHDPEQSLETLGNRKETKVFETDDPIVKECREGLLTRRFGWIRFYSNKNCRAAPGYLYPPDEDGNIRAQKVTANGYVTNSKYIFFRYDENIPESEKDKAQVATLNKHNSKFGFSFV